MKLKIKWNYKVIKKIVDQIYGCKLFTKGNKYELVYVDDKGYSICCQNANKLTVKKLIEKNFNIEIVI